MRSNITVVERSIYQVFDNIPEDYHTDKTFIKDFIERLGTNTYSHEEIMAGVIKACEKRKYSDLMKIIVDEIERQFNSSNPPSENFYN